MKVKQINKTKKKQVIIKRLKTDKIRARLN